MRRLRRHMTILERRKLREEILARELALAHQRASEAGLTLRCQDAMRLTGVQHASCEAEDPGGAGCLCQCHDVISEGVVSEALAVSFGQEKQEKYDDSDFP
jgi:hypothetical protein